MKNNQVTADEKKVREPVASGELRPYCACLQDGRSMVCSNFTACTYWRQLNKKLLKNSWLDRFMRAFVATRVQGRVFTDDMIHDAPSVQQLLFTPLEGKHLLIELKSVIYRMHENHSFPIALYLEGYKVREIADILEISFISVLMRIARARRQLLSMLKNYPFARLTIHADEAEASAVE